jgi:hypothetical protein
MTPTGKRFRYKLRNGDIVTAFEFTRNITIADPAYERLYVPLHTVETFIRCEIEWDSGKGRVPYGMPPTIHDKGFDITHVFNEETKDFEEVG